MERGPDGSLLVYTAGTITFTEVSLRGAFPHLVNDGDSSTWPPIARRLLGQRIEATGMVQIVWDEERKRVVEFQGKADMLTPLLKLLGSLEEVSVVFGNSLLLPEYLQRQD